YISFYNDNGTGLGYVQGYGADLLVGTFSNNLTGSIQFYNHNNVHMTIHPNSNVGIGNTTPGSPLSFSNALGKKISFWNNGASSDYGIGIQPGTMQLYTAGQDLMTFGWGSSNAFNETMRYATGSGQLMIGTSAAAGRLHLATNDEAMRITGIGSYLSFYNGATYRGYLWNKEPGDIELGTAANNTTGAVNLRAHGLQGLTVQSDGRTRAGALACVQPFGGSPELPKLSVHGAFGLRANFGDQVAEWAIYPYTDLNFFYNGGLKAWIDGADGDWVPFSDARLKESFKAYKPVLEGVRKLEVLTYHYKADKTGKTSFGLVAQNVQEYFPEIVSKSDGKEDFLGIAYGKTGVLAIKAIQEQQVIIEAQQKQIETLEKRLAALEKKGKY
ncbi:MAG: tail fiber domain-containing protein, partial [Ferruginibacter sp.]